jgi:D-alanyl-D-alanine carboxypeptidase/D-alanyl-D-alanine-endopeptidase (penicillin-binding protein 4)
MLVPSRATNVLWHHESAPLAQIVSDMWHRSDNFYAEMLLRELDWAATHAPATLAGGLALEHAWLQAAGGDPTTLTLADGSGLSQYNRISPRTLLAILRADWNGPNQAEVLAALPVAGRVSAKTGSMSHVRSLAGYVVTRTHGTVAFVLMLDDWMGSNADDDDIRTAFCARLAGQ